MLRGKRSQMPLELGCQAVLSCQMRVLSTEPGSCAWVHAYIVLRFDFMYGGGGSRSMRTWMQMPVQNRVSGASEPEATGSCELPNLGTEFRSSAEVAGAPNLWAISQALQMAEAHHTYNRAGFSITLFRGWLWSLTLSQSGDSLSRNLFVPQKFLSEEGSLAASVKLSPLSSYKFHCPASLSLLQASRENSTAPPKPPPTGFSGIKTFPTHPPKFGRICSKTSGHGESSFPFSEGRL